MRFFTTAFLFLFLAGAGVAAEGPLRVAVDAQYPPFGFIDAQGNLTGFDVDIAKALCARMKRECIVSGVPFDDILPGIVRGDIDIAVAGFGNTEERLQLVNFTDRYYRSHSVFLEKAGAGADVSPDGLAGKVAGVQTGSAQEAYMRRAYPKTELLTLPEFEGLMADLRDGKTTVALVEGLPGFAFLKTPAGDAFEVVGGPVQDAELSGPSYIAVSKKLPQVVDDLNKALEAIRQNGEYARINRKYFDFNIY